MNKEIVERSSGYWIVNSEGGVADHPLFDLQPYVELDEAVRALEAFENLEEIN
tara:strand:+ start:1346 stop:1504 length:159 start_codon:yes stop_codon:yes gene_type:complete